jgi:hypothetical protein
LARYEKGIVKVKELKKKMRLVMEMGKGRKLRDKYGNV